jgi:hypothetical protein
MYRGAGRQAKCAITSEMLWALKRAVGRNFAGIHRAHPALEIRPFFTARNTSPVTAHSALQIRPFSRPTIPHRLPHTVPYKYGPFQGTQHLTGYRTLCLTKTALFRVHNTSPVTAYWALQIRPFSGPTTPQRLPHILPAYLFVVYSSNRNKYMLQKFTCLSHRATGTDTPYW